MEEFVGNHPVAAACDASTAPATGGSRPHEGFRPVIRAVEHLRVGFFRERNSRGKSRSARWTKIMLKTLTSKRDVKHGTKSVLSNVQSISNALVVCRVRVWSRLEYMLHIRGWKNAIIRTAVPPSNSARLMSSDRCESSFHFGL